MGFSPTPLTIPNRVFTKEVGTMGPMELYVTDPRRQINAVRDIVELHRILVSTALPLDDGKIVVQLETVKVTIPHGTGWMVSPALYRLSTFELESGIDELHGFDSLLS